MRPCCSSYLREVHEKQLKIPTLFYLENVFESFRSERNLWSNRDSSQVFPCDTLSAKLQELIEGITRNKHVQGFELYLDLKYVYYTTWEFL